GPFSVVLLYARKKQEDTIRMPLTGYRIVHVDAYSYRRKFTIKDKPDKPKSKKASAKRRGAKKTGGYNFETPSTGRRVAF
ncbi:hypothetical protein, partial [Klebsiella aerogenes]|uniref:hypothetical protein n=1 Tax=Klebsiella aerogenes TaxID=548 RepID=UPI001CC3C289